MNSKLLQLLLIISFLFIFTVRAQQGECTGSKCGECVENPNCGWCSSNISPDACLIGTPAGPTDPQGRCKLGEQDDEWYYGSCPDVCQQFGVCFECQQNRCGYCVKGQQECTAQPGRCDPQYWRPAGSSCDAPVTCEDHSRCKDCLNDDQGCQYCPSTGECSSAETTSTCGNSVTSIDNCPDESAASSLLPSFFGLLIAFFALSF